CQGSTVSGDVLRPGIDKKPVHSMGQLIWRYHPESKRYEIFGEGGGNTFGIEIDSKGRIFSGHNGGDTRGFHYVQGGYSQKGFSKHGPLSNPFTFGYFPAMKHANVPRFTHAFAIYEGAALPEAYRGRLFGVAPLQSHVVMSEVSPDGSTFQTKDVGLAIESKDDWFRPVNVMVGPDGAIYVCDMYEAQIAHLRHHEGKIDSGSGRIYRLKAKGAAPLKPFDLSKRSSAELVELLDHENKWFRRQALRLLGDRKDASLVPALLAKLEADRAQGALEALWALNLSGGFNEAVAAKTLNHANPSVRSWTVRLLGDAGPLSPSIAPKLAALAGSEPNVEVRSQLASTAKRLPAEQALPIVRQLISHAGDAADAHLPLLIWWAIEAKAADDQAAVLGLFADKTVWQAPLAEKHLLHRVMRRFAATGARSDLVACAKLLALSPDQEHSRMLMRGFEEAYQGRPLTGLPTELIEAMSKVGGQSLALGLRQGKPEAIDKALAIVADDKADGNERLQYIQIFGEVKAPKSVPALLGVVRDTADDGLRMTALTSLQPYSDPSIPAAVIELYGKFTEDARSAAQTLLASRKPWALELVQALDDGKIDPATIPLDTARKLTVFRDDRIAQSIAKHWGTIEGATTAEMQRQIERLRDVVAAGSGSPYPGKKLFKETCAKCHRLFDDGGQIGPDLTSYKRDDVANMLINIVNPSAEVREGFETYQALTDDG
ncbi:MAG TPA: c-type cytochrome, partial [Pirellulales bacterium]|nr:c-type cytochrome [Pirellulales bacterium]